MESWNNIINTAMIGTDKKMIGANELPGDLQEALALINAEEKGNKEETFLQTAALVLNYRQCGIMPLKKEQAGLTTAPQEEKRYCNNYSLQSLKDVLSEESVPLLKLWLQYCFAAEQIVRPELIPALLSLGVQHKNLQSVIACCCGKRGEWLGKFNEEWNFSSGQTMEERWQTGTPEQRKNALRETRVKDPALSREWILQTWPQEDAATKVVFLQLLADGIGEEDIPFLESLNVEKSKKVKDEGLELLKLIPGSSIVLQYKDVLKQAIILKKERALLGLTSKTVLYFQLPPVLDEAIFKTGIEKLSNNKEFTDDNFIIYQLIQQVPPLFWETQLESTAEQVIQLFQKDAIGKKMIPALVIAIKKFNDQKWAFALMQYSEVFYIDIIPLIPMQQQEYYSNHFFEQYPDSIIRYAIEREAEWGIELAKNIFRHAAKNIYQYNRSFFNQHIHLIPGKIALELEKFTPKEEHMQVTWSNTSEYILKLLHLKSLVIQSFNNK